MTPIKDRYSKYDDKVSQFSPTMESISENKRFDFSTSRLSNMQSVMQSSGTNLFVNYKSTLDNKKRSTTSMDFHSLKKE